MIFVTVGTHPDPFTRLVKHMDQLAAQMKEGVIIQKGYTLYTPTSAEYFEWAPTLDSYFKKARIVISHAAMSVIEFAKKYQKPVIMVPRQVRYKEHINDHQVEFAEVFSQKTGISAIGDISVLTAELLKNYKKIPFLDDKNLLKLQQFLKDAIQQLS